MNKGLFFSLILAVAVLSGCAGSVNKVCNNEPEKIAAFTVNIDYSQSFSQMVENGKYNSVNEKITEECFPIFITAKTKVTFQLFYLNEHYAGTGEVLAEMKNRGLRPATLPELLAFGAQFPDEQRKYPIVALGSGCKYFEGCNFVPALIGTENERHVGVYFDDYFTKWNGAYRFLVEEKY